MRVRVYVLNGISEPVGLREIEGDSEKVAEEISQLLKTHKLLMIEVKRT